MCYVSVTDAITISTYLGTLWNRSADSPEFTLGALAHLLGSVMVEHVMLILVGYWLVAFGTTAGLQVTEGKQVTD